jgi:hypothetical protein
MDCLRYVRSVLVLQTQHGACTIWLYMRGATITGNKKPRFCRKELENFPEKEEPAVFIPKNGPLYHFLALNLVPPPTLPLVTRMLGEGQDIV